MTSIEDHIRNNLYEFYDRIAVVTGINSEEQDHWSVLENIPGHWPRLIYRIHPEITSTQSSAFFSEKVRSGQYPELLIAGDENIRQIDPYFRQQGYYPFSAWKGMALCELKNIPSPEFPDSIEIVKPKSIADLEQWLKIVNTELISSLQMDKKLLESLLKQPEIEAYLLKSDGIGASTILVFESADSIGLYMIATEKSVQKRGFASLLIQFILSQISQRTQNPVILHATQQGEALYLKSGFRPYNQFFLYRLIKSNT